MSDVELLERVEVDAAVMLELRHTGAYLLREYDVAARCDRFVELLDLLEPAQREAIGLSPRRLAALAMLDELRGLFATDELAAARRLGDRVRADLAEAFATTPSTDAPRWRPLARDAATLGQLAEQALVAFCRVPAAALRRVDEVLDLAAELAGEPRLDERRRRAFSATPPPDLDTLDLPMPVVPAWGWARAATLLGVDVDEARRMLTTDGAHFAELADLPLVSTVAWVHDLPSRFIPARTRHAAATEVVDPLVAAYLALQQRISHTKHLVATDADQSILDDEHAKLQRAVQAVADAALVPDPRTVDGWLDHVESTTGTLAFHGEVTHAPRVRRSTCVWLTDDRIAVARRGALDIISLGDRRVVDSVPLEEQLIQTCDDEGRHILVHQHSDKIRTDGLDGFGCYDTVARAWLAALPAHIPPVAFARSWGGHKLLHLARGAHAGITGQRAAALAWARGNTAVLVSGNDGRLEDAAVRTTHDALIEIGPAALEALAGDAPVLGLDGTFGGKAATTGEVHAGDLAACAIAKHAGRWRFLLPSLHVADVDRTRFRLGFRAECAAFSPDGARLLVVAKQLVIIDLDPVQVTVLDV